MDQQVTGVLIISLPPPGDPSKGKTITAFALSHPQEELRLPPPPLQVAAPLPFFRANLPRRTIIRVLGVLAAIVALAACTDLEGPLELLRNSEEEEGKREKESLVFPLFLKKGGPRFLNGEELGAVKFSRKVRLQVNSSVIYPVSGDVFPDGLYYTSIRVGNPAREYFLDVDTGSDLSWIQCDAPCRSCAQGPNPLYKPTKKSLVPAGHALCRELRRRQSPVIDVDHQCDYEIAYADHSSSIGVLAKDDLDLQFSGDNKANPTFVFGCAYDQKGQLLASPAKTDGVLGLTGSKVSLPSQLSIQGLIVNVIGHCIKSGGGGGYLFLGVDFVPQWGMTWVPMADSSRSIYEVEVKRLTYGNTLLGKSGRKTSERVIFDTGSTYTYFTNEAYADLLSSVNSVGLERDDADETLPVCWRVGSSIGDVRQFFSPLTLHFESKWWAVRRVLRIQPEGYLVVSNRGNVCLGILNGTEVNGGSETILGDISLRGLLVVYDNVERQVGWVQSDCRRLQKAIDFSYLF